MILISKFWYEYEATLQPEEIFVTNQPKVGTFSKNAGMKVLENEKATLNVAYKLILNSLKGLDPFE
jgi:hypothetical protein